MRRWTLPVGLGLLLLGAVWAWGFDQQRTAQAVTTELNNQYQRAFYQTLHDVQTLEALLGKGLVSGAPPFDASVFAEIRQTALLAQREMSSLPVQDVTLLRTMKYLNQVADYSGSVLRGIAQGKEPSAETRDTLRQLQKQAAVLNTQLHDVERQVQQTGADFWDIRGALRQRTALKKPQVPEPREEDFISINRQMEVFPTLIYDGPFSDHLERPHPLGLTGRTITGEEARTAAIRAVDRLPGVTYTAQVIGQTRGAIPAYRVEVVGSRGRVQERITMDIAKKGGEPVWFLSTRLPRSARISAEAARARAERYLAARGKADVEPSYFERQENAITFNFATRQNGVVMYPDLIKVTVALDNGQVIGLEQRGFLMQHHRRTDLQPRITVDDARKKLSPNLTVTGSRLAVIPTDGGREVLTWEFRGKSGPNDYLVYIDAKNGAEVKILQLVDVREGILTM